MATTRLRPVWQSARVLAPLVALMALARPALADTADWKLPSAFQKPVPETIDDLKQIQAHVKTVIDKVMPAVVNIKCGPGQGSGIIVTEDGYVLTAGHVSQKPGQTCTITFPDGKEVKGTTLGWNKSIDNGLVKITTEGKYPYCEMGKSGELKKGEWCLGIGHPGGYKQGRSPPVRLGRVLDSGPVMIRTDCVLVGGDSGGPLFDMQGRVIGIHSQIKGPINNNIHVPVDTYREMWERLAKGDTFSGLPTARLGIQADPDAKDCKISRVDPDSAADKAGLKVDDVIIAVDGKAIANFDQLKAEIDRRKPGQQITLQVRRGEETITLQAVLGKSQD